MAKIKRKTPPTKLGVRKPPRVGTMPLERYRRIVITIDGFRAAIHNIIEDELTKKFEPKGGMITSEMRELLAWTQSVLFVLRDKAKSEYDQEV